MDELLLGLRLLLLLTVANTAPIVLKRVLGGRTGVAIDFGRSFLDGRPWLGPSKTWRGLAAAMLGAAVLAPLLGFSPDAGALSGLLAMTGDALSSFVKRRLGLASGDQAFGLDQIPEVLLPLLGLELLAGIPWEVSFGVLLSFVLLETPAAWLAHHVGLRDRPY